MSEPFLLAASLLTAASPAVPPPQPTGLDSLKAMLTASRKSDRAVPVARATVSTLERLEPEFSQGTGVSELEPVSGSQLYQQRWMALQAGKLFTRLTPGSFAPAWANTTEQPTHQQWQALLAREARAVVKGQGTNRLNILVGDSLSLWYPSQFLPGGKFWLNQGISGENSGQILKRLPALDFNRPQTIYVMAGINDLRQGASDREILDNLRAIARHLRNAHPNSEIVLQSILPTRNPNLSNARIRSLNRQLVLVARAEGVSYLNLHDRFADEQGQMRADLTTDGLHLNRRGYEVWQAALEEAEAWIAVHR
ncbi:MAG: GDSL-type esterase/lipase family protein [Cyanobacteriota bacterium]|nr:GDSL-type esterase/lipase family protein [Cyanobacteriota bacterium]